MTKGRRTVVALLTVVAVVCQYSIEPQTEREHRVEVP